jgi:hypothetical protein
VVGVFQVFDHRSNPRAPKHGHEIKSTGEIFRATTSEVRTTGKLDPAPLGGVHGIDQFGMLVGSPRLDLDKNKGAAIERDEIDFAKGAAEVSCDDAVTAPPQKPGG